MNTINQLDTDFTSHPRYIANTMGLSPIVYFIVSLITGGLYFYYFQYKFSKLLKTLGVEGDVDKLIPWFKWNVYLRLSYFLLAVILILLIGDNGPQIARLVIIPAIIFEVMWSFKARSLLSFYIADKYKVLVNANGVLTFFFPGLALTLMFNRIEEEIALLKAIRGEKS